MRWRTAFVLVLSIGASSAFAQTMYKSTMLDGRVIYGEKPEPNAKKVDTLTAPAGKSGVTLVTPNEKARIDERAKDQHVAGKATQKDVEDARKQLKEAEAALEAAKKPLPGERIGTAGGGSRLTDAYQERVYERQSDVDAARARLQRLERAAR